MERVNASELCLAQGNGFMYGVRFLQHVKYLKSSCVYLSLSLVYSVFLPTLNVIVTLISAWTSTWHITFAQ